MGSAQGLACRLYHLYALQMLAGGDVQKDRLTAMHERILQRTIPIEEVCDAADQFSVMRDTCSTTSALLINEYGEGQMHKLCMYAASRPDHYDSTAAVCPSEPADPVKWHAMPGAHRQQGNSRMPALGSGLPAIAKTLWA